MMRKYACSLLVLVNLGFGGCSSIDDVDALPASDRYETADVQRIASSLLTTGEYHDDFGLEVHAKNVRLLSENALLLQSTEDGTPVFIRHRSPHEKAPAAVRQEKPASDSFLSLPEMLASGVKAHDALISLPFFHQRGWLDVRAWHVTSDDGHSSCEIEFNTNKAYFGKTP
jgi:hypothetical protein